LFEGGKGTLLITRSVVGIFGFAGTCAACPTGEVVEVLFAAADILKAAVDSFGSS